MNEYLEYNIKAITNVKEKYLSLPIVNFKLFFTTNNIKTLQKIGIIVEDRLYTEYEFDLIEMKVLELIEQKSNYLEHALKKEYEKILDILNQISSYYNF